MLRYITASAVNAHVPTFSKNLDENFCLKFESKLLSCNFSDEKCAQLVSNLHDTANRICDAKVPVHAAMTTWWVQENVLCFNPSNVDVKCIASEQRASLFVMHEQPRHSRIHVILDISKMTMWTALYTTSKASYGNIVDGLRLWSTIPHSIQEIHVIRSSDSKFQSVYDFIVPRLLSKKLQQRIRVSEAVSEVIRYINAPPEFAHTADCAVCDMDCCERR